MIEEFLKPEESVVTGNWVMEGKLVQNDDAEKRIDWLVKNVLLRVKVGPLSGGWEILYQDPRDMRYWEKTYPHSYRHGGGPQQLICLSEAEARSKYLL